MAPEDSDLKHIKQARHNKEFHDCIEDKFPNQFYDWKITILFYTALHYLKALAENRGINIGNTHYDIENSVNPERNGRTMTISKNAWLEYKALFRYSQTARYEGITDFETYNELKKIDYKECVKHLGKFKKYIEGKGVICDTPPVIIQKVKED